jgi:hypothetical protein
MVNLIQMKLMKVILQNEKHDDPRISTLGVIVIE